MVSLAPLTLADVNGHAEHTQESPRIHETFIYELEA